MQFSATDAPQLAVTKIKSSFENKYDHLISLYPIIDIAILYYKKILTYAADAEPLLKVNIGIKKK